MFHILLYELAMCERIYLKWAYFTIKNKMETGNVFAVFSSWGFYLCTDLSELLIEDTGASSDSLPGFYYAECSWSLELCDMTT